MEVSMREGYFDDLNSFLELSSAKFEYLEPSTLAEACSLFNQHKEKAKLISGGTALIPLMKQGKITPEPKYLINLKNIPNLEYVDYYNDFAAEGVKIGAMATLYDLSRSVIINERADVLVEAIKRREMRFNKTRWAHYMATIGGSLFSPEIAADIAPPLMILNAKAVMQSLQGWETVPIENLFAMNDNEAYEILGEIRIPKQQESEVGFVYEKSVGTGVAPSIGAAVYLRLDPKHVNVEELRIVVGGIGAVVVESTEGVGIMVGSPIDDHLIIDASEIAAGEICGDESDAETVERVRDLIEEAIRHAIDRSIGDFALGY
jgi:carbon-monoxide dehydrogenase medium subunit